MKLALFSNLGSISSYGARMVWIQRDHASGLLMGGADNGNLFVWNPAKIINNEDPLVHKLDKHSGAVAALDINPFQVRYMSTQTT